MLCYQSMLTFGWAQDTTDLLTDDAKKWRDEKAKKEADKQAEIEAKMQVAVSSSFHLRFC